ncbi:hypothetical protein SBD_4682 [Streptomyces bottropensis ATCC 25435]|uniref:Uncharacterized protein n=1 Tax=Streptomyces bottropensis ATCC 25435 TaxID=1054862 RepID=M3FS47_9ACTN|nr:hypothetical protein SBD_4682 [Streptomyces bottropensis ATCC 25435]
MRRAEWAGLAEPAQDRLSTTAKRQDQEPDRPTRRTARSLEWLERHDATPV